MLTSRAHLVADLHASGDELVAAVGAAGDTLDQGRYENGWTARQILAHVAAIEWTYPKLIEVAAAARAGTPEGGNAEGVSQRPISGGMDAYNARQVAKRAEATTGELLDEFRRNRNATIAAVAACAEELLGVEMRSSGGIPGPLIDVLRSVAVGHVRGHAADIRAVAHG